MAIQVKCPNPKCGKAFSLKAEMAGKKVRCSQCKTAIAVPGPPAPEAAASGPQQESTSVHHHPGRLVCTNCGAILGVRDAICSSCGGDVRSGVTVMRITEEEKKRAGLFRRRPRKKRKVRRARSVSPATIGIVVVLVVAAVAGALWWTKNRGASGDQHAEQRTEAPETTAP